MQKITFRKLIGENYIYPELQGHFIEFLGSCIYDGIWVGEDSEIPNYHGIRKDLVDAFQKLHPPVIRWPGGCYADVYHWRNGIGPRENRPVTYNENFGTFETDPNQFGTHEMMEFCEMIGAKPWFNINDVGVKTINKFNPIPYSTLKNSYFVVYRRGLGNI